jgi:hypothetical protein
MRGYKEYMDTITVSPELRDKINNGIKKERLTVEQAHAGHRFTGQAKARGGLVRRYTAMVAGIAALVFAAVLIPRLSGGNPTPFPNPNGAVAQVPGGPTHEPTPNTQDPTAPPEIHELVFNEADSVINARLLIPDGYFDYDLTDEQRAAVFPGLGPAFSAAVQYRGDASIWFVTAWGDSNIAIYLAPDAPPPDTLLFHGGDTVVSDVHGVPVTAFMYDGGTLFYRVSFAVKGVHYRVEAGDFESNGLQETARRRVTEAVNHIILAEGADLSVLDNPVIPNLRNDSIPLAEARQDPRFGAFLPQSVPAGFTFNNANRRITTREDSLSAYWDDGRIDTLTWAVRTPLEADRQTLVSVNDRQRFDVSLYPIPWAVSVPDEYFYYFQFPVFRAEELTLEAVTARARWTDGERGVAPAWDVAQFGVLYGDENVIVVVSARGVSPQEIWEMLHK